MNPRTAEALLPCYRAGHANHPRIAKAVRVAEGDPALRELLETQVKFDERIGAEIRSLPVPADLPERLAGLKAESLARARRSGLAWTAAGAAVAGVLLIVGLFVWWEIERQQRFAGRDAAEQLVRITRDMSGHEFRQAGGAVGELGDWFYMHGFEGFSLPADLAKARALGCRVFQYDGKPVAQVALAPSRTAGERNPSVLLVLRAADFQVDLPPDRWREWQQEGWAVAMRRQDKLCTVLTLRGTKADLAPTLRSLDHR